MSIGASRPNQSRIVAPGMNEDISSRKDVQSTIQSDVGEADKVDTAVQQYLSDKWNAAPLQIVEGSPKSIFREIVEKSDLSERMNLANSLSVQTPELVLLRHMPMQTYNVGKQRGGGVATRIADQDGIWRPTLSDIKTALTHGDVETRSEKLAYRKFIKDLEFETRQVFERENIDENQMNRSENSSTRSKKYEPKANLDPDPSSSDSSDSSSSDSAPKRKKSKKKKGVVSIGKMTRQTHPQVMTLIHPRTVIIGVNDAKIRNTGKRIRSEYAQL